MADYFITRNKIDDGLVRLWKGKPTCYDGQYASEGYIVKSIGTYDVAYFLTLPLGECKLLTNNEYDRISMIPRKNFTRKRMGG